MNRKKTKLKISKTRLQELFKEEIQKNVTEEMELRPNEATRAIKLLSQLSAHVTRDPESVKLYDSLLEALENIETTLNNV